MTTIKISTPLNQKMNITKTLKAVKKTYTAPTATVIELPDTPKLLATGRYVSNSTKPAYTNPNYRVFDID